MPKFIAITQTFKPELIKGKSLARVAYNFHGIINRWNSIASHPVESKFVWEIGKNSGYHIHGMIKIKSKDILRVKENAIENEEFGHQKWKVCKKPEGWEKYLFKEWKQTKRLVIGREKEFEEGITDGNKDDWSKACQDKIKKAGGRLTTCKRCGVRA